MSEKTNIEQLIIHYLQKDITEGQLLELDKWIHESDDNKAEFFHVKAINDNIYTNKSISEEEKEESWQRMYEKIKNESIEENNHRNNKRRKLIGNFLKYAAIILIALAFGWEISENKSSILGIDEIAPEDIAYNIIQVEKGGKPNTLILTDGSKVVLNAATTFKYPANFSAGKREVYLDGEAYFEIAHNSEKPFVVKLNHQNITVLGTKFNVEAYSDKPYSITTLISGKILLETFDETGDAMSQMYLKPNQKATADNKTGSVVLEYVDVSLSTAWIKGEYKFKDEPLLSIIQRLEKYYGVTIRLEDDSLKTIKYTGTFSTVQSIKEVLQIINYQQQFSFTQTDNFIHITPR